MPYCPLKSLGMTVGLGETGEGRGGFGEDGREGFGSVGVVGVGVETGGFLLWALKTEEWSLLRRTNPSLESFINETASDKAALNRLSLSSSQTFFDRTTISKMLIYLESTRALYETSKPLHPPVMWNFKSVASSIYPAISASAGRKMRYSPANESSGIIRLMAINFLLSEFTKTI